MGMNLDDHAYAIRLKKIVTDICKAVIDRERPKYRYAIVDSYDRYNRICFVKFIGEEKNDPVKVNMGAVQPTDPGVLVRVAGRAGDLYVDAVMDWQSTLFVKNLWSRPYSSTLGAIIWHAAIDPNPDWAQYISGESMKFYNANVGSGTDVLQLWHLSATNPKGKVTIPGQLQLGGAVQRGTNWARYYRAATAQSIAPNTWTDLSWDTKRDGVEDDGAMLRSADKRFLQCGTAGFFSCSVMLKLSAFTGYVGIEIYDDGGELLAEMPPFDGGSLLDPNVSFTASFPLASGKGVRVQMRHSNSANVTVTNGSTGSTFSLAQISG